MKRTIIQGQQTLGSQEEEEQKGISKHKKDEESEVSHNYSCFLYFISLISLFLV